MSENTSNTTTVKPHFKLWAKKVEANEVTPQHPHKPFPGWVYGVLFVIFDIIVVTALEVGVSSSSTRVQLSSPIVGFGFVSKMWTDGNFVFVLNVILVALLYLMLLMLFNRFWTASIVILAVGIIVAAIEHFKVEIRYEAILPADLGFLGSNTGNMLTFIPAGAHVTILVALGAFAVLLALILVLRHFDGRKGRMIRTDNLSLNLTSRLILLLLPILVFALYCIHVSTTDSLANKFSRALGDTPSMWDSVYDAQRNGPLVAFTRQLNPKIMDKPSNYSEETMKKVAARYQKEAETINASRTNNLTDSTVVYVLSESFSDPSRVPGLKTNKDSMPNIRKIKAGTTSGLMLSSGYGGGTANLEYMGLSGLSMANFESSLSSPYQQLVPSQHWTPTINQLWGAPVNSLGYHPYESSMYSRATNYKKFGFSHFYTLTGPDVIKYQDKIDESPYVSDKSSYDSALEGIKSGKTNKFIQIITMQNHMPYDNWYFNNQFEQANVTENLNDYERGQINTYAKGVSITDQATIDFLNQLNAMDKPITVIFYGDHLPSSYQTAAADKNNTLALHQTDYFIWSNQASASAGVKLDASNTAYTSPNYFMEMAAEHMNAKVSPYLAFLTQTRTDIPALERLVIGAGGFDTDASTAYLDQNGNAIKRKALSKQAKNTLHDYKLIQYDMTAGKGYLNDTNFFTVK